MKLKTYMCRSMDEALQTIRAELGPDAVIISSLDEGDKIRVTAACENIPDHIANPEPEAPKYTALETKNILCHVLSYHGVPATVSDMIIGESCRVSSVSLEGGVAEVFKELLAFAPLKFNNTPKQPQQIMLAGPVGVGKTVTLSKIASEYRLKNQPVEIISADYLKAGATEQIQAYASAIEVPLTLVQTPTELEKKLSQCQAGVTYLIDTPGTNALNPGEVTHLTDFILAAKQAPYLVLAAGGDPYEMQDTAAAFKDVGSTRFMMTRFDAAKRFGGLLSILFKERLEFSAMSCGPEIGSRLKEASSANLFAVLKAYLPDVMAQKMPAEAAAPKATAATTPTAQQQNTQHPRDAELPAWVKGFMEAKKA